MADLTTTSPNRLEQQLEQQLERLCEVPAFARPWFRSVVDAPCLTDEAGIEPVECEFVWAGIPSGPRKS